MAQVREAAQKKLLFLPHSLRQMLRPDRMISTNEVRTVIERGEVIEDYPEDVRGHSCLLLGRGEDSRAIHIVCAPKAEYLVVITAYLPEGQDWSEDFRRRKEK